MNRDVFWRLFKYLFAAIVGLVLLLGIAVAVVWFNLDLILNEKNLARYKSKFLPTGMELTWNQLEIKIDTLSFGSRRINVNSAGLCLKYDSDMKVDACLRSLVARVSVQLLPWPKLLMLDELRVVDEKIHVQLAPADPNAPPTDYPTLYRQVLTGLNQVENLLNRYLIEALQFEINNFKLLTPEKGYQLTLNSLYEGKEHNLFPFALRLTAEDEEELDLAVKMSLDVEAKGGRKNDIVVDLKGRLTDKKFTASLRWTKNLYASDIDYQLDFGFRKTTHLITDISAHGRLGEDQATVAFSKGAVYLPKPLQEVSLSSCQAKVSINTALDTQVRCRPRVFWDWKPNVLKNIKSICKCTPPTSIGTQFDLDGPLQTFIDPESRQKLNARLKIDDFEFQFLQLVADAKLTLYRDENKAIAFDPEVNARLDIRKFEGLVAMLKPSPFAIPAPFHVLKGNSSLTFKTVPAADKSQLAAEAELVTDLRSPTQRAQLNANIQVGAPRTFKPPFRVSGDVLIKTLYLELPPFYPISGLPHVIKSSKIKSSKQIAKQNEGTNPVIFNLRVRTEGSNSLRLASNLADPYVPLLMNLHVKPEILTGELQLTPFQVKSFGRTTFVDDLKLTLPKNKNENPYLDTNLRMNQSGYEIFIQLTGKTDDLQIFLRSNPSLPRSDIISILLYGRTFDNLEGQQRENVGSAGAAIADRAIGLFGIWAFASTPIQSIAYNPTDKSYSAQLKVDDETVFSVGTDWERVQNLELRRHLTGNWMVVTSYEPGQDEHAKGSLFLQWQRFY